MFIEIEKSDWHSQNNKASVREVPFGYTQPKGNLHQMVEEAVEKREQER